MLNASGLKRRAARNTLSTSATDRAWTGVLTMPCLNSNVVSAVIVTLGAASLGGAALAPVATVGSAPSVSFRDAAAGAFDPPESSLAQSITPSKKSNSAKRAQPNTCAREATRRMQRSFHYFIALITKNERGHQGPRIADEHLRMSVYWGQYYFNSGCKCVTVVFVSGGGGVDSKRLRRTNDCSAKISRATCYAQQLHVKPILPLPTLLTNDQTVKR